MQTLNLHIKHRLRINLDPKRSLNMMRKPLLIALLHSCPLLLERGVINGFEKAFEFVKILQPDIFGDFEGFGDETAETGVALISSSVSLPDKNKDNAPDRAICEE